MTVTVTPSSPPESPLTTERRYQFAILVLVVLVLIATVFATWLVSKKNTAEDDLEDAQGKLATYSAGPEARDAAEDDLREMISYDYRHVDDEYTWLDRIGNDKLRSRLQKQTANLAKVIKLSKVTAKGEIVQSAYNTIDENTATVLAFVRQTLSSPTNKHASVAEQWTTLKMTRDDPDSPWLIDDIDIVDVPPPS